MLRKKSTGIDNFKNRDQNIIVLMPLPKSIQNNNPVKAENSNC